MEITTRYGVCMIVPNVYLNEWKKVCDSEVIGKVGNALRFEGGSANPTGNNVPKWVTKDGVDIRFLYLAHCNIRCFDYRGEDVECG